MPNDKRAYPRITIGCGLRYEQEHPEKQMQKYMDAIAENIGLGGVFIATKFIARKGRVLKLTFTSGDGDIQARGIVRWVRNWMSPRGMGVEFIEFEGDDHALFLTWLERQRRKRSAAGSSNGSP